MMTSFLIPPAVAALITALCTAVLIRRDRRRMTSCAEPRDDPSGPRPPGSRPVGPVRGGSRDASRADGADTFRKGRVPPREDPPARSAVRPV